MANETNGGKLILETTSDQLNIQTIQFIYPSSATKGKQIEHKIFLTDLHFFTFLYTSLFLLKKKKKSFLSKTLFYMTQPVENYQAYDVRNYLWNYHYWSNHTRCSWEAPTMLINYSLTSPMIYHKICTFTLDLMLSSQEPYNSHFLVLSV